MFIPTSNSRDHSFLPIRKILPQKNIPEIGSVVPVEILDKPSIPSYEVPIGHENKEISGNIQEPSSVNEADTTENKVEEPAEPSAFHVVSYPDGHKELTTDLLEACNPIVQPEISASACHSIEPSGSGEQENEPKLSAQVKHFSAKVVQQEHCENSDTSASNKEPVEASLTETEENQVLAQTETEAVQMEGVNIEDIDDAVERALLGEVGEDSCGKSAGDNSIELEGLQAKSADLNEGCDPGQSDSTTDILRTPQAHRIEKVYDIDEETRMGLDATPVSDQPLLKESFTYPSLPPKKLFQIDDTKDSEASDTETKMSMSMTDTEDIRLSHTVSIDDSTNVSVTSDSNTEAPTPTSTRKPFRATREGIGVSHDGLSEGGERVFTAENLFEYQWPLDGGEWHLLQEQVSEYLKIKSFKRKYPDLDRRVCDKEEKDFLRDRGVVTETQSDLGLTALRSEEVYDLMMKDYNDKYQEYITFLQEKQRKVIREKHKEYSEQAKIDKSKMESYSKKAARSAAEFNAHMMREKKDERRAYFDLQTYTVHFPKSKFSTLPPRRTKIGAYPVAVLTGQYQDHFRKYNPEELKYFPVKTVLQDPRKPVKFVRPMPESVRLAILEKQKPPPPPPEEKMEVQVQEVSAVDDTENKENTVVPESMAVPEVESVAPLIETVEPFTPQAKVEKKSNIKSSGKKRPKIELSPERPKKTFKKARESLRAAEATIPSEDSVTADGTETNTADGKNLIPKIHGLEKCRICKQRSTKEERKNEKIVKCAQCGKIGHTSCLDLTEELVAVIKTYPWQCMECKTCVKCLDPFDEDKMMFCDRCDRGYHTFCIGLEALPTGHWECGSCEGFPIILAKKKSNANEGVSPEQIKSEGADVSSSPAAKTDPPIEPTLKEKQELLEEGEIRVEGPITALPVAESGLAETASLIPGDATGILTPASLLKIERRGRKRKYPADPTKAKSSPKKPKANVTPKQDRVTGERQSKRLKIKEEEEEEKKEKELKEEEKKEKELKEEEEKKEKKLKGDEEKKDKELRKKKKRLRKLAAEAAASAAAAAAEAYAASHPDEDCGEMLAQSRAQKMKAVSSDKSRETGEAKDTETTASVESSQGAAGNGGETNSAEVSVKKIEDSKISEEAVAKISEEAPAEITCDPKVDQKVADTAQSSDMKSSPPQSVGLHEEPTSKGSEPIAKNVVETDVPKVEESSKVKEESASLHNVKLSISDKLESTEISKLTDQPATMSSGDSESEISGSSDKIINEKEAMSLPDQIEEAASIDESIKPSVQEESQDTTVSNKSVPQASPTAPSSDSLPVVQTEPESPPKSVDLTSAGQASDQAVSDDPLSNPTECLVKTGELPISSTSAEEMKLNVQTEKAQDNKKSNMAQNESKVDPDKSITENESEASLSLKPEETKEVISSSILSSESTTKPQAQQKLENETLSSTVTTSKPEDLLPPTQTSDQSQAIASSESENPQLSPSASTPLPSSSHPSTELLSVCHLPLRLFLKLTTTSRPHSPPVFSPWAPNPSRNKWCPQEDLFKRHNQSHPMRQQRTLKGSHLGRGFN
ncbi:PHD finger protein 10 [Elysia marginata]|uniref:PHD finger protein 10 n=1 Tax=Elysia marginata TaxID=1093978 RepID=A0AAV4IIX5_9GAST|nr:PHD finger protein 10 [Elysia marginata]